MIVAWLDSLKKYPRMPAAIERYSVARSRSAIQSSLAGNQRQESTLWLDVSVISRRDAGSGIQRVVRALMEELQAVSITGWRIQPVAATPLRTYCAVPWGIPTVNSETCPRIEPQPGDIFLGLDLSIHIVPRHQQQLAAWKASGLKLVFVIYDLLPLHFPHWFSAKLVRAFRRWIKSVAILADQVFCISQPVKRDFDSHMQYRYGLQINEIPAHVIPMGADIKASKPSVGLLQNFSENLALITEGKAALMVGTIEPRKGYVQILDTFEYLWAKGKTYKLVIVGRPGWMTEGIQARIKSNVAFNQRLFWFENASDEALQILYQNCTGVIVASYAEGYGLPQLEALEHGKQVLARDLTVFRQFETPWISYFPEKSSIEEIAAIVERWFEKIDISLNQQHVFQRIDLPTWRTSLKCLLDHLSLPVATVNTRYSEME
jgi:glycosyltransferase involved in cell wall biosynthesis